MSNEKIKLIGCTTKFTQIAKDDMQVKSNCLSITFYNQSTDSRDVDGVSTGYRMLINNALVLVPGQSVSIAAPSGFYDKGTYTVSFQALGTTPGGDTKLGVIARVYTDLANS